MFMDYVMKVLVGQNVTTGVPMYKCMEMVLKGEAKAKFYAAGLLSRNLHSR